MVEETPINFKKLYPLAESTKLNLELKLRKKVAEMKTPEQESFDQIVDLDRGICNCATWVPNEISQKVSKEGLKLPSETGAKRRWENDYDAIFAFPESYPYLRGNLIDSQRIVFEAPIETVYVRPIGEISERPLPIMTFLLDNSPFKLYSRRPQYELIICNEIDSSAIRTNRDKLG